MKLSITTLLLLACYCWTPLTQAQELTADEARAIAQEAYIYGFPINDNYRIQYSYFVDKGGPEYKGPWNRVHNSARVFTPEDKAIQTPNSDTPYSQIGADLRSEPLVISVPEVEKGRYYSLQFVDMYTYNFAYVGSRATGNDAGNFLLAGPDWKGEKPEGIKAVLRCETQFAFVLIRTQLFNPEDLENVRKVQEGYHVQPLSRFLNQPAPEAAPAIDFPRPLSVEQQTDSLDFFKQLNFLLQFCPPPAEEKELLTRFAKLGIGANGSFDPAKLPAPIKKAVQEGMADAWKTFTTFKKEKLDTGKLSAADGFGTREFLKGDYLSRMASAKLGIYGNSKEEALYPAYFVDDAGEALSGAHRYTLTFAADQLPPVNAFWSLTLYQLPSSLLYANPLGRYLINSPMLPSLKKNADGGITFYLQFESPGDELESNWLPVPKDAFWTTLRLYWPKAEALDGRWKQPPLKRVD